MGNLPQLRGKLPNELGQIGIAFLHSIWDMLHTHTKCFHKTHEPIKQLLKTYTELILFLSITRFFCGV
jgi:hypothetical protein